MIGRRVYPDEFIKIHDLEPGDYAKANDGTWWLRCPNGTWGRLRTTIHNITEHEDGTISVTPSILIKGHWEGVTVERHGFLTKGVWTEQQLEGGVLK